VEKKQIEGLGRTIEMVPIEHAFWVLEPARLCKKVTGKFWHPFVDNNVLQLKRRQKHKVSDIAGIDNIRRGSQKRIFERLEILASYGVAQIDLLTNMCKGRSCNVIRWLEKDFPYDLLVNIATNPLLPYSLQAAVTRFMIALYVDRIPQIANCGAPFLPEKIWIYDLASVHGPRLSSTPGVESSITLASPTAFPSFFLSRLCSVYDDPNPVLSLPDTSKYLLLRNLCSNAIQDGFGPSGRIVHDEFSVNELGMAG